MKKILIMCGTGVATSTVVKNKVEAFLQDNALTDLVQISQSHITNDRHVLNQFDLILSTTHVSEETSKHVINAVPILTGIGSESVFNDILESLQFS